ncbi:MAG: PIN domain-containing protein [Bdellovibrionales bacterium]
MERVVLDANVLFSNNLRTLFLWLSWNNLFEIVWSQEIWNEVLRNYSEDKETAEKFTKMVVEVIFTKFSGSMRKLKIEYQPVGLPDSDDEHVVALARQEQARRIVTFNERDFPEETLSRVGLHSVHPDPFLCELFDGSPDKVKSVVSQVMASYTETKPSKEFYLECLRRTKVQEFVERLEEADETFPEVWPKDS